MKAGSKLNVHGHVTKLILMSTDMWLNSSKRKLLNRCYCHMIASRWAHSVPHVTTLTWLTWSSLWIKFPGHFLSLHSFSYQNITIPNLMSLGLCSNTFPRGYRLLKSTIFPIFIIITSIYWILFICQILCCFTLSHLFITLFILIFQIIEITHPSQSY